MTSSPRKPKRMLTAEQRCDLTATTTITNRNPPANPECGLKNPTNRREESDTPQCLRMLRQATDGRRRDRSRDDRGVLTRRVVDECCGSFARW